MINNDRIVPVTKTDLLSLYSVILKLSGADPLKLESVDVEGNFVIGEGERYLANQPVKKVDIDSAELEFSVYFVADAEYEGFYLNGVFEEAQAGSAEVKSDGSLYEAILSDGVITINQVGF